MSNNILFSISTQLEMEGRQLKAIKPNKQGIYEGIPLTVIGCNSRNKVNYERRSVERCLTDTNSRFAANVQTGDLEGEWGHPLLVGDKEAVVARLLHIDRSKISHTISRVYGKDVGDGLIIVYGDIKPFGPFGKYLKESFEDPTRNTSFSLRAAARQTGVVNGIVQKTMLAMVTFDAVDGPGFLKASKRFQDLDVGTMESLGMDLHMEDPAHKYDIDISVSKEEFMKSQEVLERSGLESVITNQQVLEAFGCDQVKIKDAIFTRDGKFFTNAEGCRESLFDKCFGL